MSGLKSWSYSAISMYKDCPKKYEIIRAKKLIQEATGKAADEGTRIHTLIENYLMKDEWNDDLTPYKTLLDIVKAKGGQCEVGYHFRKGMERCEPDDPFCWVRSYIDWIKIDGNSAELIDWKTGRVKPTNQLGFYAWLVFTAHPEVEKVKATFHWINKGDQMTEWYERKQMATLFRPMQDLLDQIEMSFINDVWVETGNGCKWCTVTNEYCSNGKG